MSLVFVLKKCIDLPSSNHQKRKLEQLFVSPYVVKGVGDKIQSDIKVIKLVIC